MKRLLVSIITAVTLVGVGATEGRAQDDSGSESTTLDGVFTEEQARRGEEVYADTCANCHPTSRFEGSSFLPSWTGAPVSTLFTVIRTQMPFDNPGSLDRAEYAAVVAYIFELNGFPAGESPLPASADSLSGLTIQPSSGS